VQTKNVSADDFEMLINDKKIMVDDKKFIHWIMPDYSGDFDWMKYFAERGCLMLSSGDSRKEKDVKVAVWIYPVEVFRAFREIYIATYKIKGMQMLHIGKSSVYELLRSNQIRHVRVGKKYIIPKSAVIGFVNGVCYNNRQIIDGGLHFAKGVSV